MSKIKKKITLVAVVTTLFLMLAGCVGYVAYPGHDYPYGSSYYSGGIYYHSYDHHDYDHRDHHGSERDER